MILFGFGCSGRRSRPGFKGPDLSGHLPFLSVSLSSGHYHPGSPVPCLTVPRLSAAFPCAPGPGKSAHWIAIGMPSAHLSSHGLLRLRELLNGSSLSNPRQKSRGKTKYSALGREGVRRLAPSAKAFAGSQSLL